MFLFIFENQLHLSSLLPTGNYKLSQTEEQLRLGADSSFSKLLHPVFLPDMRSCLLRKQRRTVWPRRTSMRSGQRGSSVSCPPDTHWVTTQPDAFSDLFRIIFLRLKVF